MHQMRPTRLPICCLAAALVCALAVPRSARAQELPPSGTFGVDLVYATTPGGASQLYAFSPTASPAPIPIGAAVNAVPSRWAHRRRTLSGLETAISYAAPLTLLTPTGDAPGNGAIHLIDARTGFPPTSTLVPTKNPAAYDLAIHDGLQYVFSAEDDGLGNTLVRGWSWATPGLLVPLSPPTITLLGGPAAYVNRMDVDASAKLLHVPTTLGVGEITLSANAPQMSMTTFISSSVSSPSTNVTSFMTPGGKMWIVGLATFSGANPIAAGWLAWSASGPATIGAFGTVPSNPAKSWVPAVGCEELAVVSNGTDAYVYSLLREPLPGTGFVKGAAVGAVRWIWNGVASNPTTGTILLTNACGEPFSIPSVHGTRVAFESSFGAPFILNPPDGGERANILYTPLDPLGTGLFGVVGVPAPFGGRVIATGMDRPIWSKDGTRVFGCTSDIVGLGNPLQAGLEVMNVPANVVVSQFTSPHQVIPNPTGFIESIILPTIFAPPPTSIYAGIFGNFSFVGNMFDSGLAAATTLQFGEIGQFQQFATPYTLSSSVPAFPSILPATFNDPNGSIVPVPLSFGARRTSFNVLPYFGLYGLTMVAAIGDHVLLQETGINTAAAVGLVTPVGTQSFALPVGAVTTTEFLSL